jgi:hypothetical protein
VLTYLRRVLLGRDTYAVLLSVRGYRQAHPRMIYHPTHTQGASQQIHGDGEIVHDTYELFIVNDGERNMGFRFVLLDKNNESTFSVSKTAYM